MVGELAGRIAKRMGLPRDEVELARLAGRLHDIGKLAIPEDILRKPGPLNDAERLVLERHPHRLSDARVARDRAGGDVGAAPPRALGWPRLS